LGNGMPFIGDQGWFYLSARDLLVHGQIPLVGIASSHTWLHQGPLWTYMLSFVLLVSKFNPISGAYLTVGFGVLTTFLMYLLGKEMFSQKVGLIAALLYSSSPLIISFDRMAFDPSLIPFFTVLYLFALVKWLKGNIYYFPLTLLLLAILYNLELATFTLTFPFILIFIYGLFKRATWIKKLLNIRIILSSVLLPSVIMLPVIIYDFSNGFKQTIVFVGWDALQTI
jgi:4-amino-4-deoxy-L-arabinose transferase-like glycosyltransferase